VRSKTAFIRAICGSIVLQIRYDGGMSELLFLVEDAPEGGYTARALGQSIFTEADTLDALRLNVREAVECHFEDGTGPKMIRLHFVREEVLTP
jgi:hypothetical protein